MAKLGDQPLNPHGGFAVYPELGGHTLAGNPPRDAVVTPPSSGITLRQHYAGVFMNTLLAENASRIDDEEGLHLRAIAVLSVDAAAELLLALEQDESH